ncbi:hypothetical protein BN2537_8273 [Streptomyces venezuelae]|nr:hypothetical protein BN2537_8273 [Streptomyces venezuelae]
MLRPLASRVCLPTPVVRAFGSGNELLEAYVPLSPVDHDDVIEE